MARLGLRLVAGGAPALHEAHSTESICCTGVTLLRVTPLIPWPDLWLAFGSALLGGALIGAEREWMRHDAGVRTNALVAFGACVFGLLSRTIYSDGDGDPGRIAAQVVSGIGFLGAGIIMQRRARVIGLTTAAALWVSAAVGLAAGAGESLLAITAAGVVLAVQTIMRILENRLLALRDLERGPMHDFLLVVQAPSGRDRVMHRILREFTATGRIRLRQATVAKAGGGQQRLEMHLISREQSALTELQALMAVSGYTVETFEDQGPSKKGVGMPHRRRAHP